MLLPVGLKTQTLHSPDTLPGATVVLQIQSVDAHQLGCLDALEEQLQNKQGP